MKNVEGFPAFEEDTIEARYNCLLIDLRANNMNDQDEEVVFDTLEQYKDVAIPFEDHLKMEYPETIPWFRNIHIMAHLKKKKK